MTISGSESWISTRYVSNVRQQPSSLESRSKRLELQREGKKIKIWEMNKERKRERKRES
jgi:hypothetical protein